MDSGDLEIIRCAAERRGTDVKLTVKACAYSCCGRGWVRRDGYEQDYVGYIDNFTEARGMMGGAFMLYSRGLGTISYVLAVRFDEVVAVERVG